MCNAKGAIYQEHYKISVEIQIVYPSLYMKAPIRQEIAYTGVTEFKGKRY